MAGRRITSEAPGWEARRAEVAWILANSCPNKAAGTVLAEAGVRPVSGTSAEVAA